MSTRPIIVLGAGGHARVLIELLSRRDANVLGAVAPQQTAALLVPFMGDEEILGRYPPESIRLINGLGSIERPDRRAALFHRFSQQGYEFASAIHANAVVATDVVPGEGVQIMAGAIVQTGVRIGVNVIINTGAIVDHDCEIGNHVHIAPGVTMSGDVKIGLGTHIGTGATIVQGVKIGVDVLVAAGAVVVRDVPDGATVMGVPARVTMR